MKHESSNSSGLQAPFRGKLKEEQKKTNTSNYQTRKANFKLDKDVILAESTKTQFDECLAKLRFHKIIYSDWGFSSVDPLGMSTILNFYGPPGTGKTLAAEALAGTLDLPFIQLGIAELESKFMGDTAKNIQAAFEAARESSAVIFFDEADTLLGKRLSSVTQGVDNEVNAMRSTLLIELERFDGIAIFATNFAKNYDEAFRSRISHHIKFDLPDFAARKRMWDRMLVKGIPIAGERGLLIENCSELSDGFSGREIRTCMRLSLPKALLDAESLSLDAKLSIEHLESAIKQIRSANAEVACGDTRRQSISDSITSKKLLGVN
ncbi:ATP-binding protein [Iodobacter fluviatilis]|uniref:ATP-dependent zinc metalloprotease FtsH 2 n=1 Tax=Iodobacter fluviatilis TaxID=537 RepID=A0A377Q1Z9_9NEIS|nr:ATP-binding protein [Iodobacter fluviatilis]TCU90177.1 ATPase family protein associated with various cellular activities (AAA) [Iodobacter fluviatilis]STQ89204.1 ATP-dependent zinc metalloprotease FtsH 2 [Iodobacter fluviatilis]